MAAFLLGLTQQDEQQAAADEQQQQQQRADAERRRATPEVEEAKERWRAVSKALVLYRTYLFHRRRCARGMWSPTAAHDASGAKFRSRRAFMWAFLLPRRARIRGTSESYLLGAASPTSDLPGAASPTSDLPGAASPTAAAVRFALHVAPYLAIFVLLQVVGVPCLELGAWCLSIAAAVAFRIASFAAVLVLDFPCLALNVCCLPIAARAIARAPPELATPAPTHAHDASGVKFTSPARALKRAFSLPRRARTRGDTGCLPKAMLPQALAGLAELRSEVSPARACWRMLLNLAVVGAVMSVPVFGLFSVTSRAAASSGRS